MNFVDLLRLGAQDHPEFTVFTFLDRGEREAGTLDFAKLDHLARARAVLIQQYAAPGDRVLLLYRPGLEFIAAFFGCLYAGVVAVPVYPPRANRHGDRLKAIIDDASATLVLTTTSAQADVVLGLPPGQRVLATDSTDHALAESWQMPDIDGETIAFLQYTSGSTGHPKGVMVTHANIYANARLIGGERSATPGGEVQVSWLPFYHDMGLIFGVLQPVYRGMHCYLMPPVAFLQRPMRWLKAISRFRGTHAAAPNFAYDLCLKRMEPELLEELDLSSWKVAYNGAEPVRDHTIRAFCDRFASCGFSANTFCPAYGMAEATLKICSIQQHEETHCLTLDRDALERKLIVHAPQDTPRAARIVSCGKPENPIAVVDPRTNLACPPGYVGEIWVSGPSISQGYWNRPKQSAETFRAYRKDTGEGPFLRTGDLGFLEKGELYLTGRYRDLIIIHGRNHHPEDIEVTVSLAHPVLKTSMAAAFAIESNNQEQLVVAVEIDRQGWRGLQPEDLTGAIRDAVAGTHELVTGAVVLLRPGRLPRTSSGKPRRQECRSAYRSGDLEIQFQDEGRQLAQVATAVDDKNLLNYLRATVAAILECDPDSIEPGTSLARLGFDSVCAAQLQYKLETDLDLDWPLSSLLAARSLAQLAALNQGKKSRVVPIGKTPDLSFPLTYNQQSLWHLYRLQPEDPAYNLALAFHTPGGTDPVALEKALHTLVRRQPSLRTVYDESDGAPYQRITEFSPKFIEHVDARAYTLATLSAQLRRQAQRPFHLQTGPVFRVHLYHRTNGRGVLLLTAHHIACDLRSLETLLSELATFYKSTTLSHAPPAEAPSIASFSAYQAREAGSAKSWSFWKQRLAGGLPTLTLPIDRSRKLSGLRTGARFSFAISAYTTQGLRALSHEAGATLFTVLLSAFQILLHRICGRDDIWVGTPSDMRDRAAFQNLVGYLVNPIVQRGDLSGNPQYRAFLGETHTRVLATSQHRYFPYTLLTQRLSANLFDVMFSFERGRDLAELGPIALGLGGIQLNLGDLKLQSIALDCGGAQYELGLSITEMGEGLTALFDYDAHLFTSQTISCLSLWFTHLLEGIVSTPGRRIGDLPLLNQQQKEQLLCENEPLPLNHVHLGELFLASSQQFPDAIAVQDNKGFWSNAILADMAHALARRLVDRGIGAEIPVAVLAEPGLALYMAMQAVFEAGGVWLPLDPASPQERLEWMLTAAAPGVILVQPKFEKLLPSQNIEILCLNPEDQRPDALVSPCRADNTAWLLFTSGTTGKPKAVAVSHLAAVTHVTAFLRTCPLAQNDRVLQFSSPAFDVFCEEVLPARARVATLVSAPSTCRNNAAEFQLFIERNALTQANLPASFWHEWVDWLDTNATVPPNALRLVIAGSERVDTACLNRWQDMVGNRIAWFNGYGTTETTITATLYQPGPGQSEQAAPVPIGEQLPDCNAYLLDRFAVPVPAGVTGELFLAGNRIARGYHGMPAATAAAFVPHPFSAYPGARLYRTGDLARLLPESKQLVHLGRRDRQLKIRGFRVEPAELEAVICQAPGVQRALVVPLGKEKELRLFAYVQADETRLSKADLRAFLATRVSLPPSGFLFLASFPLTSSNKIDGSALPVPEEETQVGLEPISTTERLLAGIWSELLERDRVYREDDFFALGGHSLMAARVNAKLADLFRIELSLAEIFQHSRLQDLAQVIDLARTEGRTSASLTILPSSGEGCYALSFFQQALWFHHLLECNNPEALFAYNMPLQLKLNGPLDILALQDSWHQLTYRHEILRCQIGQRDGIPYGETQPTAANTLLFVDLSGLQPELAKAEASRLAQREARRPFDLEKAPLVRTGLLRLEPQCHCHLATLHHIVSDGWSLDVLLKEITTGYTAALSGKQQRSALALQYRDFAAWQHGDERALETGLAWWRQRLAGMEPLLQLPSDRPRPSRQSWRGDVIPFALDAATTRVLHNLARQNHSTLFLTLEAAFALLLARHTGRDDVPIGTLSANRPLESLEHLIGPFINPLVLRNDLRPGLDFSALIARVRQQSLDDLSHGHIPFGKVVEALHPERQGYSPLFQVLFVLQNTPFSNPLFPGLATDLVEPEPGTAKYDLTLSIVEHEGELSGSFEYNTDLFEPTVICAIRARFVHLLKALGARPDRNIETFSVLTHTEKQRMLVDWNHTQSQYEDLADAYQLFLRQAEETPQAVAVFSADGSNRALTYAALATRAFQVACHLRDRGAEGCLVGICMDRGPDLLACLLGTWAAGCGYVAIDASFPKKRLAYMLEDSGALFLLTQGHLESTFADDNMTVIHEETIPSQGQGVLPEADLDRIAYVLYTSGSTGQPKGVRICHRTVAGFLFGIREVLGFCPGDRVFATTTIAFDISIQDLFLPLITGATVVLADESLARDGVRLARALDNQAIRFFQATPATWRLLLETGWRGRKELNVLSGGEALDAPLAERLLKDNATLYNLYGPTETTIWTSVHRVAPQQVSTIPLGRPLANVCYYLLDKNGQPVPPGVPAELSIGGDSLALGYHGLPAMTALHFVPDHLGEKPGARLYRSGDQVCFRSGSEAANDQIEFVGRSDRQVKLRGFRVELAEIEAHLLDLTAVATGVVLLCDDGLGDKQLVAYVVAQGRIPNGNRLRTELAGRLPAYMVPAHFIFLDALPLTSNGKIDRGALPLPKRANPETVSVCHNSEEELLATIWGQVLNLVEVPRDINFFDLGGHSLLAARVISGIGKTCGVQLPLAELFEAPGIAALAPKLARLRGEENELQQPILPANQQGAIPLSPAQQRLFLLHEMGQTNGAYNLTLVLRLDGPLDPVFLEGALADMLARHESLRTRFGREDGSPVQHFEPHINFPLTVSDFSNRRQATLFRQLTPYCNQPFDLNTAPLLRHTLARCGSSRHFLVVVIHHLIADGWSLRVLARELLSCYNRRAGFGGALPDLPIQFSDYCRHQMGSEQRLTACRAFWLEELKGVGDKLPIQADRKPPHHRDNRGARLSFRLEPQLVRDLEFLSRRERVTLFTTLQATFGLLLSRHGGRKKLLIGTAVANRERSELESLIGFFVNTLPLRLDLTRKDGMEPSFRDLLARVQSRLIGALEHAELPFEQLVAELRPERIPGQLPLVQISFTLHEKAIPAFQPSGLKVRPLDLDTGLTRFDMEVDLWPDGDSLNGSITYATDLFEYATASRLCRHFRNLLVSVSNDPSRQLSLYECNDREEQLNLLQSGTARTSYPVTHSLHELFAMQVLRTPQACAISAHGDRQLTYAEIQGRAHGLALTLRELGAGPDCVVGLCLKRSPELIISMLAILECGAAYLPLDPHYPSERLAYMLEDAAAILVVGDEDCAGLLPAYQGRIVQPGNRFSDFPPALAPDPSRTAYLMFTSGSTGRPKPVGVTHANVVRLFSATRRRFRFDENDVWTLFHSHAFDFSTWEIWGALLHGSRLVMVPFSTSRAPDAFYTMLCKQQVSVLNQTPSAFRQLVPVAVSGQYGSAGLRLVVFGGEALDVQTLAPWFARFPNGVPQLVNMYGITETTVHVTWKTVDPNKWDPGNIGAPLGDLDLYLLDDRLQLAATGAVGQIYVGGAGLSRGYLRQPALTAERFLPNAFHGTDSGSRLYRTGDLARYLPNGDLVYLGRADKQVQLRGFRIEPAEIDSLLTQQPHIRDAVTLLREDRPGDQRLVTYLVPDPQKLPVLSRLSRLEREGRMPSRARKPLPNGMIVADQNRGETEFLYREIFEQASYLQHGICIEPEACIFDVGAHIGLASLSFGLCFERVKLFAFEPIPPVFELLRTNVELYGLDAVLFDSGVGSEKGSAQFTWYPNVSVISGRYANADEERQVVKTYLQHQKMGGNQKADQDLEALLDERLQSRHFLCPITTISQVIEQYRVEKIDLLKIDAEKSEWDVLKGIHERDWPKIEQIVAEVHDRDNQLKRFCDLLQHKGFGVAVEQDPDLIDTGLYTVYARRGGCHVQTSAGLVCHPRYLRKEADLINASRAHLVSRLPPHMVPGAFVLLDRLPLTANGKLDKSALHPPSSKPEVQGTIHAPRGRTEAQLAPIWAEILGLEDVDAETNFFDLGGHSMLLVALLNRIRKEFCSELTITDLFRNPTLRQQAEAIDEKTAEPKAVPATKPVPVRGAIAVIGFAGRFPGAPDVSTYWENLRAGIESITHFSLDELRAEGLDPELLADPDYVAAAPILEGIETFDAAFFGITPLEAKLMDPQHRFLLETAWTALEHGGYAREEQRRQVGLFAGVGANAYQEAYLKPSGLADADPHLAALGNGREFLPTRIAYKLGLEGPAVTVQTACSTSLVAVHLACRSLADGECAMALAGGVSIALPHRQGYRFQTGLIFSPDGHCRAFDADAAGTVPGSGLGLVLLKPLDQARADRDTIHAVISGSAMNNDGSHKVGYTAPGSAGQAAVIRMALRKAGLKPHQIGYIETHGTGTPMGDPIEVAALAEVFAEDKDVCQPVVLSSVKTNIGHLDAAAGIAGLIKAILVVKTGEMPPCLHFRRANPELQLDKTPFCIRPELSTWQDPLRRAGVSSFGIGGTNAHLILESPPQQEAAQPDRDPQLLLLSARDARALGHMAGRLATWLADHPEVPLADVAHTLRVGRSAFNHRRFVVCADRVEAQAALCDPSRFSDNMVAHAPTVAFLFPGQDAQTAAGRTYSKYPVFQDALDQCCDILRKLPPFLDGGLDPNDLLLHPELTPLPLGNTLFAQPALFSFSYALSQLWISWGIRPSVLLGHSLGEFVAACLAEVFSLEDALKLVCARACLMQATQPGAMLAVSASASELALLLPPTLSVAAVNGPDRCTVSGSTQHVTQFQTRLQQQGVPCQMLKVQRGFHSALMNPVVSALAEKIASLTCRSPQIPIVSSVTGSWLTPEEAMDPHYWATQVVQPVRFSDALSTLLEDANIIPLEIGGGRALTRLVKRQAQNSDRAARASFQGTSTPLLASLGWLWTQGCRFDRSALSCPHSRRLPLPTYPFQGKRHWPDPIEHARQTGPVLRQRAEMSDWFYLPSWKRLPPFRPAHLPQKPVLVFGGANGAGEQLVAFLRARGAEAYLVEPANQFQASPFGFRIDPSSEADYDRMLAQLADKGQLPETFVHLWTLSPEPQRVNRRLDRQQQGLRLGFYSLLYLARALGKVAGGKRRLLAVTTASRDVMGSEPLDPIKSTLLGPIRVIPVEYPRFHCSLIDISPTDNMDSWSEKLLSRLVDEIGAPDEESLIALRGTHRWAPCYEPVRLEPSADSVFQERGVYLITGGSGGVGLALARHLARQAHARLVLVSRGQIDPAKVRELEDLGAEVLVLCGDVTDRERMAEIVDLAMCRFGQLNGVIHSAGLPGGATIQSRDPEKSAVVMAPKLSGTAVLEAVLAEIELDFLVLCSSLTSVLGGIGQTDYCAANAYLDAFATSNQLRKCRQVLAIGWDTWKETGMAAAASGQFTHLPEDLANGIAPDQGGEVLRRALASGEQRVLVATVPFDDKRAAWRSFDPSTLSPPRPNQFQEVAVSSDPPTTETEARIATLWCDTLGLDSVGIHDDYFSLGGDTLTGALLLTRIHESMSVELPPAGLFEQPTIAGQARLIEDITLVQIGFQSSGERDRGVL